MGFRRNCRRFCGPFLDAGLLRAPEVAGGAAGGCGPQAGRSGASAAQSRVPDTQRLQPGLDPEHGRAGSASRGLPSARGGRGAPLRVGGIRGARQGEDGARRGPMGGGRRVSGCGDHFVGGQQMGSGPGGPGHTQSRPRRGGGCPHRSTVRGLGGGGHQARLRLVCRPSLARWEYGLRRINRLRRRGGRLRHRRNQDIDRDGR